jgi:hypothetical protein
LELGLESWTRLRMMKENSMATAENRNTAPGMDIIVIMTIKILSKGPIMPLL